MVGMSGRDSVEGRDSYGGGQVGGGQASGGGFGGGGRDSGFSLGLGSFANALRSAPGNIARDLSMASAAGMFANRDKQAANLAARGYDQAQIKDYFDRTDATAARGREQAEMGRDYGPSDEERRQVLQAAQAAATAQEQGPVYRNPFGSQNQLTVAPPRGEVTPDMRREALRIFESQRGAGQTPYQMLPYQQGMGNIRRPDYMPGMEYAQSRMQSPVIPQDYTRGMPQPMQPNPNVSPAFQYAAQNYQRLGGSQRLMDRPMEMMSVGERQRINEMAQGMADAQRPTLFAGKGAGMQRPTMSAGKGAAGTQQPEALGRVMPLIGQMGIASLLGAGRTRPTF